jgi:hypothetical protein
MADIITDYDPGGSERSPGPNRPGAANAFHDIALHDPSGHYPSIAEAGNVQSLDNRPVTAKKNLGTET